MTSPIVKAASGKESHPIWFGGWQASGWSSSDEQQFASCLKSYLELGGNAIDTAEGYGDGLSEKLISTVISQAPREELIIATKFHHYRTNLKQIERALDRSLANLGTDYVDILYQHWPAKEPLSQRVIDALYTLRERGKIRYVGVSNWSREEFDELEHHAQVQVVQNCHSLLWSGDQEWFTSYFENEPLPFYIAYSPLAQGLLAGRSELLSEVPSDHRSKNLLYLEPQMLAGALTALQKLAEERDAPPAALALGWVLSRPFVKGVVVGSSTSEQLHENFTALNLLEQDFKLFEQLSEIFASVKIGVGARSMWSWHPRLK